MSSSAHPARPRASSYILVSSSSAPTHPDEAAPTSDSYTTSGRSRPRLFFLLPLVALLDIAAAVLLGVLVLRHETRPANSSPSTDDPILVAVRSRATDSPSDDATWERQKIVMAVVAFSVARATAYAIIGISTRIRQLGVTVAAISILSTLFYVSVANLLFQARAKPDVPDASHLAWSEVASFAHPSHWIDALRTFRPTMPILVGAQQAFTLFEWILYIAVVGVKIPPGGNPVTAKRWARNLAQDPDFQRGVDAQSLYPSEDGSPDDREQAAAGGAHAGDDDDRSVTPHAHTPTQHESSEAGRPLLGTSPVRPRGYGSTLSEPRTPQGASQSPSASTRLQAGTAAQQTPGMGRSASNRSGMYSKSPGAAELALPSRRASAYAGDDDGEIDEDHDEDDEEGGESEEAEGSDPDDIIDITPNRAVARKEARLRLARAALPERRASVGTLGTLGTLSIFGNHPGGGSSESTGADAASKGAARGPGVFSDEAGSPLARKAQHDEMPATQMTAAASAPSTAEPRQASMGLMPSSSSTRSASTRTSSASKERKFKLPRWLKPGRKK